MPQPHTPIPPPAMVDFPICNNCGALMQLARIEPDEPEYERRYFECTDCGKSETLVVKYR
jgi:hypothetical protein